MISKNLVEKHSFSLLDCMTNTYNELKNEFSIQYPDVTDPELNEMTSNLIEFFTTLVQIVSDNASLNDVDDT